MHFDHDWWFSNGFSGQIDEAKRRLATLRFGELDADAAKKDPKYQVFLDSLETRCILYLRDGFSYEVRELIRGGTTSSLAFECLPTDEAYRVGCFVVIVPFDDIVRVEVFAVHRDEKPEDMPSIKGFGRPQPTQPGRRQDDRHGRRPEPVERAIPESDGSREKELD